MKPILTFCFFLLASVAIAQPSIIELKSGQIDTLIVNYLLEKEMMTSKGAYLYSDVEKISFFSNDPNFVGAYTIFREKGLQVIFLETETPVSLMSPLVNQPKVVTDSELIVLQLSKFNRSRLTGKGLQIAGLLLSTLSLVSLDYDPETASGLVIVGGGVSLVGFFVDMAASQHLTRLEREFVLRTK